MFKRGKYLYVLSTNSLDRKWYLRCKQKHRHITLQAERRLAQARNGGLVEEATRSAYGHAARSVFFLLRAWKRTMFTENSILIFKI